MLNEPSHIVCFRDDKTFVFMPRKHLCLLVFKPLAAPGRTINAFMLSFLINFTLHFLQYHVPLHVPQQKNNIVITLFIVFGKGSQEGIIEVASKSGLFLLMSCPLGRRLSPINIYVEKVNDCPCFK